MPRSTKNASVSRFTDPYAVVRKAVFESSKVADDETQAFFNRCDRQQAPGIDFSSNVQLLKSIETHNPEFYQHLVDVAKVLVKQGLSEYDTHGIPPLSLKKTEFIVVCQQLDRENRTNLASPKPGARYNKDGDCRSWVTSFSQNFIQRTLRHFPNQIRHCLNNLYINSAENNRLESTRHAQGLQMFYEKHVRHLVDGKDFRTGDLDDEDEREKYEYTRFYKFFAIPTQLFVDTLLPNKAL